MSRLPLTCDQPFLFGTRKYSNVRVGGERGYDRRLVCSRSSGHAAFYLVLGILGFIIVIETFVNELSFFLNEEMTLVNQPNCSACILRGKVLFPLGKHGFFSPQTTCQLSLPQIEVVDFSKSLRL